jgi:oligoendopeptidase F
MTERGEGLTADALCKIYRDLNAEYFGPDVVVDDEIALEWARIPHFYYDYYVYQYSTGYAAAIALSQKILNEGETALEHYLGFLKGGCSKPPIDLLRDAGVDMATAQPIDDALSIFAQLIDEMDALMSE